MYNKVILAGNLTRDIEIRYTQGGMAVASTGIASNRKFKSATGEQKEEVLFIDLTFFGRTAEIANQYLRKGSKVLVDGRLKLDSWTAQDGSKRSKHSVTVENLQMLSSRDEAPMGGGSDYTQQNSGYNNPASQYNTPSQDATPQPSQYQQKAPEPNIPEIDISEDEIPF
jgi:single-strand DNA-binding protein